MDWEEKARAMKEKRERRKRFTGVAAVMWWLFILHVITCRESVLCQQHPLRCHVITDSCQILSVAILTAFQRLSSWCALIYMMISCSCGAVVGYGPCSLQYDRLLAS